MRSDQIHRALSRGINRFEVCALVSKGVRRAHKTGSRFEDSINDVLQYIGVNGATAESMHSEAELAKATKMRPAA